MAILLTLIGYKVALLAIGLWARRRTHDTTDFYLGGRELGAWVAAISASASSSSAWTLLGVSGAAFVWGLPALWLFPATVGGFLLNWFWVAPRLMPASRAAGAITLTEFIAGSATGAIRTWILRFASAIVVFSFTFYVASQFQAAGDAFASTFSLPLNESILIGAAVILLYTLLGGFWAVSVTDTLQGLLMALTAVLLPVSALLAVGGPLQLWSGLHALGQPYSLSVTGEHVGIAGIGFVLGTLGIGLGYPGQPHVVNRFMALKDPRVLRQARRIAVTWAVVVYAGMLILGLCGRVLLDASEPPEQIFFALANELYSPVLAGIMIAAVLSAIMSTADSQLLVASSSVAYDWRGAKDAHAGLTAARWVVVILSSAAVALAIYAPQQIFSRVLFAWHALGSAFGPLVIVQLLGRTISPIATLAVLMTGFALTVLLNWLPDTPGDFAERLVPFFAAFVLAMTGSVRFDPNSD